MPTTCLTGVERWWYGGTHGAPIPGDSSWYLFGSVSVPLKTPRSLENTHKRRDTATHAQSEDFGNREKINDRART